LIEAGENVDRGRGAAHTPLVEEDAPRVGPCASSSRSALPRSVLPRAPLVSRLVSASAGSLVGASPCRSFRCSGGSRAGVGVAVSSAAAKQQGNRDRDGEGSAHAAILDRSGGPSARLPARAESAFGSSFRLPGQVPNCYPKSPFRVRRQGSRGGGMREARRGPPTSKQNSRKASSPGEPESQGKSSRRCPR
jgi:hypothetical protein